MKLSPMRYKNYVWPYNPKIYGITYERRIAAYKIPFGTYAMQDLGMMYRVLRGEGEFAGKGAYDEFKKLATVFYEGGAGILVHPVWQSSNAHFVSLSLLQEPREDYVRYTFEFWEDHGVRSEALTQVGVGAAEDSTASETLPTEDNSTRKTCVVVSGDTMWGIANRYGISFAELIANNPQIKNPNLIHPGDVVYIS